MSTLSPTLTFASAAVSSTRVVYFHPFGPVKVIEGTLGSIAAIIAVIFRWCDVVAARVSAACTTPPVVVSTSFSPAGFTDTTMFS